LEKWACRTTSRTPVLRKKSRRRLFEPVLVMETREN
jgi:hypothetical protein